MVTQSTPDAGITDFWYNSKSQLRLSRNAQQLQDSTYAYTRYDSIGRVKEVGLLYSSVLEKNGIQSAAEDMRFPLASDTLSDITWTYYDLPADTTSDFIQENLRNRVSYTEVTDGQGHSGDSTNIKTYFSYDIHGNVKSLRQKIPGLAAKDINYVYDLVSNKVNYVFYQFGKPDQFAHNYTYDADNRIKSVHTSTDRFVWNHDAEYSYYEHGPLARVELGEHSVQGQDYYYTLQGWLKGVNMPYAGDPNDDGINGSRVGKDVTAFTLGYFEGDYSPINSNVAVGTVLASDPNDLWNRWEDQFDTESDKPGLFNGNISWMVTDLAKQGELQSDRKKGMQAMLYQYDQLNRITESRSLTSYNGSKFAPRGSSTEAYDETFSYDPNGNLLTLQRWDELGAPKDDFNYKYYGGTNKLYEVHALTGDLEINSGALTSDNVVYKNITLDGTANVAAESDVEVKALEVIKLGSGFVAANDSKFYGRKVMTGATYEYDSIGNLIRDNEKGVSISWTPQGKVRTVDVGAGTSVTTFRYDAMGNRVEKKVVKADTIKITRYLRDASGNVMSVYNDTTMIEQPIYGSSRLGQYLGGGYKGKSILGLRRYELANHLGNVLSVISDKIYMNADTVAANVLSTSDYYPFGLAMDGRIWSDTTINYRYGFNGKEKDANEWGSTAYDYGFRIYNPEVGKFLSVDPLTRSYPMLSPYPFAGNSPIKNIDLDGLEPAGNPADWDVSQVNFYANNGMGYSVKSTSGSHLVYQEELSDMKGHKYYYVNQNQQWELFRDDYKIARGRQLAIYSAVEAMEKTLAAGALMMTAAPILLESGLTTYGKKVATGFANDVLSQFVSNYLLNGFNAKQALNEVDYGNALITGMSGFKLKGNADLLRKGITELAKTSIDVTVDGLDVKYPGSKKGNEVSYITELLTRQLMAQLPKVGNKEYEKILEDIGKKEFRSIIQSAVESIFKEQPAANEGNIKK